jgi:hypothetical protein
LPGDEAWLIGEHRVSGEQKYYLANLPAKTDLRTLDVAKLFLTLANVWRRGE